ncbi:MAG: alpha/beta hydrolase [Gammaproteobacteria bacterium]|nr:alpha/beta hydrolase [Gammaproteobacteria bacterium]
MPTLKLTDGAALHFRDEGAGQPLVLLHGWGMRSEVFDPQFAALTTRFRVIAPDLRGHGASSPVNGSDGMTILAHDVAELIHDLDLTQVILVGWSMGAIVAWKLMQGSASDRIAGIVIVDMVPRILSDASWPFGLRDGEDATAFDSDVARMRKDWRAYSDEFVPRNVARGREDARGALLEKLADLVRLNDPESMIRLWQSLASQDLREDVAESRVPSVIIYGERGQLYSPAAFAWLNETIPNSRRVSFSDSGHAPHLEESELFNATLVDFADRLRGEPAKTQETCETERPT